ncbi:MAG: hypothetical protein J6C82_03795 [Clostridia bacterium]|nr:hypothetical protein [Clostridia bacterium]
MKLNRDSKLLLKILSAASAIILWFAITYTEDPVISHYLTDVNIVFEGEDTLHSNGIIVTNKDSMPDISAVIRGKRSNVISSIGSVSVVIDVSGITEAGTVEVPVEYSYPSSTVTLAKSKTKELTVKTEKIISRNIPVRIEMINEDKNTEYIVNATSSEQTVSVRGAESVVYKIANAKAVVDATNIVKTSSQDYFYKFYDEDGDVVPENNIIYKSLQMVEVDNEVYNKVSLPVEIVLDEKLRENYILNVKNPSFTSINAGVPEGVEIESLKAVFSEEKTEEKNQYNLALDIPDGVYVPKKFREITAECVLVPKVLKELEIAVGAENVPEGKKVRITPEKIMVTVKGAEDSLLADKIKAKINADALTEDAESVVNVEFETQENVKVVGAYSVTAIIE